MPIRDRSVRRPTLADLHQRFDRNGVRPATAEDALAIAAINVACWREAYRDIIDPAILAGRSVADSAERWRAHLSSPSSRATTLVTEENGRVIGFGSATKQRDPYLAAIGYTGEISSLYVQLDRQAQGVGSGLIAALAQELIGAGHASATVWVLEENGPGRRFYERCKGQLLPRTQALPRLGNVVEIAYAWPVLRTLAAVRPKVSPSNPILLRS